MIKATLLPPIPRFLYLLAAAKSLIAAHGPYTTHPKTTVFTRAATPSCNPPTQKDYAISFAIAKDCISSAQPDGPAKSDLQLFGLLWTTTIEAIDLLLESCHLDNESFGWGVFGLTAGYIDPDPLFSSMKSRLHEALCKFPDMENPKRGREMLVIGGAQRVDGLVKARRQVHVMGNLMMQSFRADWGRCRWWYGVAVAERWIGRVGWQGDVLLQVEDKGKKREGED
ncbi:hypothetical protein BDV95DRAFT_539782 [Massariosphaeria phaeospora]|uniref:Uncharacterized protein n=1 Tax=Massariosphaeria phaeospora TaxID=100035 RepID=A0A7C8MDM2_9PLEO|nr:hypothetical protein BDV95DRAFT_539782 [Massariosphaeria phaeospora]